MLLDQDSALAERTHFAGVKHRDDTHAPPTRNEPISRSGAPNRGRPSSLKNESPMGLSQARRVQLRRDDIINDQGASNGRRTTHPSQRSTS